MYNIDRRRSRLRIVYFRVVSLRFYGEKNTCPQFPILVIGQNEKFLGNYKCISWMISIHDISKYQVVIVCRKRSYVRDILNSREKVVCNSLIRHILYITWYFNFTEYDSYSLNYGRCKRMPFRRRFRVAPLELRTKDGKC